MSSSSLLFLTVRAAHVLLAAAWLGTTAFLYLFLVPALDEAGTASATLATLGRRGLPRLIASAGGIVVLTGLWLYWRFTGGFNPAASATMGARVFGTGGLAGILALILSGSIVGRAARKLTDLASRATAATDAAQRTALQNELSAAKRRMATWGKIIVVLQVIALVCMAIGHYV